MPDDNYTAFYKKLSEIKAAVEETERAHVELPPTVASELYNGIICYIEAEKEFSKGEEENASRELQYAVNHVCQASFDMLKFRFLFYSKFASSVIEELKNRKKRVSKLITNYGEQSKNFPEIVNLVETAKLPSEDSPESRATCEDVIKKLQAFLSNFKTDKGELFPTKDAKPKIDFFVMMENHYGFNPYEGASYEELRRELFREFGEGVEMVECVKAKFPISVAKELCHSIFYHIEADKELFQGNGKEAMEKMKEALYHSHWAFFDAVKLRFLDCLRKAKDACTQKIKGHKGLAHSCIGNYVVHSENLHAITRLIGNKKWPDETPLEYRHTYEENIKNLQGFLSDFKKGKGNLAKAIADEQEAKKKAQEAKKTEQKAKVWEFCRDVLKGILVFVGGSMILTALYAIAKYVVSCTSDQ